MVLSGIVVALMESGLIFYSGRIIDLMTQAGPQFFWAHHSLELIVAMVLILGLRPLLIMVNHLLLEQTLAGNMQEQVRWRAHKHLLGQSSNFFQNDFAGRLSNRVMQMGGALEDSVYMSLEGLWYSITYVLSAMLIMSQIDWRISLPLGIWLVLYILYVRSIAVRVAHASEKWSDARSLVTGRLVDAYSNIESVKLFSHGQGEEKYALSAMRRLRLRFQRFLRLMTELSFGLNLLNGFLIIGVMSTAIWLWSHGTVTIGQVAAAAALTIRLNGMSGWITWVVIKLFEHAGTIREGLRSIAVEQAVADRPNASKLSVQGARIELQKVSHHYGKGSGGLDEVSLVINPGEKVGLVGRSGAGKSSLVNLLLRFRDVEQGKILIDGQDVSQVTQDSLRRRIGMVTQDSSLLHRSVRANILYGRPDAGEAQMIEASKRAEAHDFIMGLVDPAGRTDYEAFVGERGVKLSGGQRQRISIARVILKDAPILVLDEATSALDSEVEAVIQQTLYGVMEGKTVIAIAHRLSTIARMDRIIVLDQGRIIENGSHDILLSQKGVYADLWARQSGGFLFQDQPEHV
ncbi:MAG: ABC transporter ATP-binding protein/permease [Granulosicoccus sp.]|nr:ABC transporter ATP-binding protein/permease [Granulosicoccus sp.]